MNEELINDIKAGRCILFLGPQLDMLQDADITISHNRHYCAKIREELDLQHISYDPSGADNAYYLTGKLLANWNNDKKHADIRDSVYKRAESNLYAELAILPFNTIINFGFDNMMNLALERAGYEFRFDFYNFRGSAVDNIGVDKDVQLVYNLYGSLAKEPRSVVRTEQEELEFLRKVNGSPALPTDLIKRIKEEQGQAPKSYIFLGFDFNEWPYRFLLDTLQVPKSSRSAISPRDQVDNIGVLTRDFYTNRFGMTFMDESPISFVRRLIDDYRQKLTVHKLAYISFNKADADILQGLRENLDNHWLTSRRAIEFFDRDQISPEQVTEEVVIEKLGTATIYILLASAKSLADAEVKMEIRCMLERKAGDPNILLFPILARNSLWDDAFPELEEYAAMVLPSNGNVLSTSMRSPDSGEFIDILNSLNSKIR